MNRHRRALWLVGAAVLCVIAAVLWAVWPRERLLLARATRVADAADWPAGSAWYWWLSDHEVAHFRMSSGEIGMLQRFDVRTGTDSPMSGIGRVLRQATAASGVPAVERWPSPDGRWLLYRDFGDRGHTHYGLVSADGVSHRTWPAPFLRGDTAVWRPDSRAWSIVFRSPETGRIQGIVEHSLVSPGTAVARTVDGRDPEPLILGLRGDGRLLSYLFGTASKPNGRAAFETVAPGSAPVTSSVPIPRTVNGYSCVLSPRGDRLAWIMRETRVPAVRTFWQRARALVSGGAHPRIGLWVSGVEGAGLREIGHIDQDPRQNRLPDVPRAVRWTPDEKRLSFLYHGALCTVPAD